MYYRVAIRQNTSTTWQWKSTTISSLTALFQFLRRHDKIAQDRLRIFSSPCIEEIDEQIARENNGLGSRSVTAAQFQQEHMMRAQSATATVTAVSYEGSDNMNPRRAVTAGVASQAASQRDFWNLMALTKL